MTSTHQVHQLKSMQQSTALSPNSWFKNSM